MPLIVIVVVTEMTAPAVDPPRRVHGRGRRGCSCTILLSDAPAALMGNSHVSPVNIVAGAEDGDVGERTSVTLSTKLQAAHWC